MGVIASLFEELLTILKTFLTAIPYLAAYIGFILVTLLIWQRVKRSFAPKRDFASLKTITFGDESAVKSNFAASVISIIAVFVSSGAFTGSSTIPSFLHMPEAFVGKTNFTYTAQSVAGIRDDASVYVVVHGAGVNVILPEVDDGQGFAKNDVMAVKAYRTKLLKWDVNDEETREIGAKIVAINGQPIAFGTDVDLGDIKVALTQKGTLNIKPDKGIQMEPIWLPAPEDVWGRLKEISTEGFKNYTLLEHLGFSLFRVVIGFIFGALVGIPLGYAMGLSDWFRGWFDPVVEFMRPVPPLALIPLVIIWAGIGEVGKTILLFLAALWIMAIAARAGVSGVRISKVHAAYSLGASKWQVMRHVILPNSLPEIFTGARVAMGVCWGTVVAAELVAAEKGAGMMIMVASKFQQTDIVILGIILIGIIGFGIDMLMRWAERVLVPWKGRG